MTRAQQAKLLLITGRFRYGCKRLGPSETPDVMPVLALIESLDRLLNINVIGEKVVYENHIIDSSIRSGSSVHDGMRWS